MKVELCDRLARHVAQAVGADQHLHHDQPGDAGEVHPLQRELHEEHGRTSAVNWRIG
jgi:hypothetical protein